MWLFALGSKHKRDRLTRFWCTFFISLDRYEVLNRVGSGIFFLLMTFSHLNVKKYASAVKILLSNESWNWYSPEDFSSANCLYSPSNYCDCGCLRNNWICGESARNYQLMDEESSGRMVIPPGPAHGGGIHWKKGYSAGNLPAHGRRILGKNGYSAGTSSWMRNLLEEGLFRRELPAHGRGILWKNGYSAGTSSWRRNLLEEGIFPRELPAHRRGIHSENGIPLGNISSWTLIQTVKIKMHEKSSACSQFQDQQFQILEYLQNYKQNFLKYFNCEMSFK
jgi:hypothetical protein